MQYTFCTKMHINKCTVTVYFCALQWDWPDSLQPGNPGQGVWPSELLSDTQQSTGVTRKKPKILHKLMITIFIFYYTNSWHWSVLSCWMKGPEMEIDTLLCKISALVSLLSSLEIKVCSCWVIPLLIVDKTHMAWFVRGKSYMSHVRSDT